MKSFKFLAVLVITTLMAGCSFSASGSDNFSSTPALNGLTGQDSKEVMTKTLANLAKTKILAASWQDDAVFTAYNFNVPANLSPNSVVETFIFGSAKDADNWWTCSVDSKGKTLRAIIPKDDYLGSNLSPISEQYLKISYSEALKTADDKGGIVFKSQYPDNSEVLTMTQSAPNNWLWYVIEFKSTDKNQKIRISANDGNIYDDNGQPM